MASSSVNFCPKTRTSCIALFEGHAEGGVACRAVRDSAFSVWTELMVRVMVRVRVRVRVAACVAVAFSVWTEFTT
jgi:hypothetical protein